MPAIKTKANFPQLSHKSYLHRQGIISFLYLAQIFDYKGRNLRKRWLFLAVKVIGIGIILPELSTNTLAYSKYFSRPFWWENHAVCRPVALRPIPCLLFQQHLSQAWATRFHSVNQLQRIHVSDSEMHDSMYFFLVSNVIQGVVFLLFFWKEKKGDDD